jgi:hypothetical protein
MLIVCTTYFNSKKDPQRNVKIDGSDFNYISVWYNSIVEKKIKGVVFHDGLNDDFIERYQNDFVSFIKVFPEKYSLNDFRFFCYYEFIKNTNFKYYFFTDGNDVFINKNLNSLLKTYPNKYFFGRDNIRKWKSHIWNFKKLLDMEAVLGFEVPNSFFEMPVYNAGIIGGSRAQMEIFFSKYVALYNNESDRNINMALVNWIIYRYIFTSVERSCLKHVNILPRKIYRKIILSILKVNLLNLNTDSYAFVNVKKDNPSKRNILSGYPLNSEYKKFLKSHETDAFFIHK